MIVRASLLSVDGKSLQEAGTPRNGTEQPTAYPAPQSFESRVKLAVLTNDTVRNGVRLTSLALLHACCSLIWFTFASNIAGTHACIQANLASILAVLTLGGLCRCLFS